MWEPSNRRRVKLFGELDLRLKIPDLWQQEALRCLKDGRDVVVNAPTGAGKTYLVELMMEVRGVGQVVLAVPTRALANDKLREFRAKGWRVGIVTGDVTLDPEAPLVVATLETQKGRFLAGEGPDLLVVDEYQMIGDPARGVNYELCIAMAPEGTQLLLLSGSVSNPEDLVAWLKRLNRSASLVSLDRRPVPLEELHLDAIDKNPPRSVSGFWPRQVAKALMADLGPLLIFVPQRRAAEALARQLAGALPIEHPLTLSAAQRRLAGPQLERLLVKRVAYHHSGLSYQQRAALVEPLTKAGQLRVVVATTGLAAGVNFSVRSALVTEGSIALGHERRAIRPDELLQMFGRAGRRGLDAVGYALWVSDRPRLSDGRPLPARRPSRVDWPSLIGVLDHAVRRGEEPFAAAQAAASRLFTDEPVRLGIEQSMTAPDAPCGLTIDAERVRFAKPTAIEILNSQERWEERSLPRQAPLKQVLTRRGSAWQPILQRAEWVAAQGQGGLWRIEDEDGQWRYGLKLALGFRDRRAPDSVRLAAWLRESAPDTLEKFGRVLSPEELLRSDLGRQLGLGQLMSVRWQQRRLVGRFDLAEKLIECDVDTLGAPLLDPPTRKDYPRVCASCSLLPRCENELDGRRSPASSWFRLGLIDGGGRPTRRGRVFSFFEGGEGLAVAAGLEDEAYAVDNMVGDLANLRAGYRFDEYSRYSHRLARACRVAYADRSYEGYLEHGLPPQYGDGAAEVIAEWMASARAGRKMLGDDLRLGDVQRARLEWMSLLRRVAQAPNLEWDRWNELRLAAAQQLDEEARNPLEELLPLEPSQMGRISHLLRFPRGT